MWLRERYGFEIKRYSQVIGDVQTDRMNEGTLGLWLRSLKMDVREGKLRFHMARFATAVPGSLVMAD